MKTHKLPSAASLKEMPELDVASPTLRRVGVGVYKDRKMTLRILRVAVGLSQAKLAKRAGITQSEVSRAELRSDCLMSTLERYADALGGELEIRVKIDGRTYPIALK